MARSHKSTIGRLVSQTLWFATLLACFVLFLFFNWVRSFSHLLSQPPSDLQFCFSVLPVFCSPICCVVQFSSGSVINLSSGYVTLFAQILWFSSPWVLWSSSPRVLWSSSSRVLWSSSAQIMGSSFPQVPFSSSP